MPGFCILASVGDDEPFSYLDANSPIAMFVPAGCGVVDMIVAGADGFSALRNLIPRENQVTVPAFPFF